MLLRLPARTTCFPAIPASIATNATTTNIRIEVSFIEKRISRCLATRIANFASIVNGGLSTPHDATRAGVTPSQEPPSRGQVSHLSSTPHCTRPAYAACLLAGRGHAGRGHRAGVTQSRGQVCHFSFMESRASRRSRPIRATTSSTTKLSACPRSYPCPIKSPIS